VPVIDPTTQLAALIRAQVTALRRREKPVGRRQEAGPNDKAAAQPDLASAVAQRVRSLDPDDPQRARKALRIFLETVLLSELGQELVGDPAFALMVDHVQQQMEIDPELAKASAEAARLLLASADT
jgi:hypothetical protein